MSNNDETLMFAAVDLGSNSFRVHIGQYEKGGIRIIRSARSPVRLAAGLDSQKKLSEQSIQMSLETLRTFRKILDEYPINSMRIVATSTLRVARNSSEFLLEAERVMLHPIEIISGEEEGRLIYMGVAHSTVLSNERRLVLDIGGGSSELILGSGYQIEQVVSFEIGAINQSLAFFPDGAIEKSSFDAAILAARGYFEDLSTHYQPKNWTKAYGSSGTLRALADVIAKNSFGDGTLSLISLEELMARFIQVKQLKHINWLGIKPDRLMALLGGLGIVIGVMRELRITQFVPIEAGLRVGVMWDLYWRATKRDRREQSVRDLLKRFHVSERRAYQVANVATTLYQQLKPDTDRYDKLLYWSGLMHEIGLAVSPTGHHKHGAYLVGHTDIPGFATHEQRIMSRLILGQKGNLKKVYEFLAEQDGIKALCALRLAIIFLHAQIQLNELICRIKAKNKITLEIPQSCLQEHPTLSVWIIKEQIWWRSVGVDFLCQRT